MRDHDDDLDLSAWEAPPPPEGLADAVVARMGGTAVGLAMPAQDDEPRRKRWIVIAASAAAVLLLSLGTWIIVRGREHAPLTSGEVVATRAQHLELGGVSVELDRGADVTWRRDGATVHVEQKAGTAQWRIAGDQQVVIGAASASIDAAGASLRVEVNMNMSDARVIGASAITAAAVAMVTVVVYEGHVKVTSAGQTVVVQPGTTFTLPPPAPPQPEPPVVGVAPVDTPHGKQLVAILGLETGDPVGRDLTEGLRTRAKVGTGAFQLAAGSDKELADEKILYNCADEAPACMALIGVDLGADALIYGRIESQRAGYQVTLKLLDVHRKVVARSLTEVIPVDESMAAALQGHAKAMWAKLTGADSTGLTSDQINDVMKAHAAEVRDCFQKHAAPGQVVIDLAIEPDGNVASAIPAETPDAALGTCVANAVAGFAFPASSGRTRARYPFAFSSGTCDAQALEDKGVEAEGTGQHAAALSFFEQALGCKPGDSRLIRLGFMASCQMKSLQKARKFWNLMSAADQPRLMQICLRQGITKDDLDSDGPACDADALLKQGIHDGAAAQHAMALAAFEQALDCKPGDPQLTKLAFVESCNTADLEKARSYYEKLDRTARGQAETMCFKNGISHDALEGKLGNDGIANIYCKPDAKILIDGKDTGQTTPAHLQLSAGKHKLTLVVGQDRFTYPLTIKAGESATISKDLQ